MKHAIIDDYFEEGKNSLEEGNIEEAVNNMRICLFVDGKNNVPKIKKLFNDLPKEPLKSMIGFLENKYPVESETGMADYLSATINFYLGNRFFAFRHYDKIISWYEKNKKLQDNLDYLLPVLEDTYSQIRILERVYVRNFSVKKEESLTAYSYSDKQKKEETKRNNTPLELGSPEMPRSEKEILMREWWRFIKGDISEQEAIAYMDSLAGRFGEEVMLLKYRGLLEVALGNNEQATDYFKRIEYFKRMHRNHDKQEHKQENMEFQKLLRLAYMKSMNA